MKLIKICLEIILCCLLYRLLEPYGLQFPTLESLIDNTVFIFMIYIIRFLLAKYTCFYRNGVLLDSHSFSADFRPLFLRNIMVSSIISLVMSFIYTSPSQNIFLNIMVYGVSLGLFECIMVYNPYRYNMGTTGIVSAFTISLVTNILCGIISIIIGVIVGTIDNTQYYNILVNSIISSGFFKIFSYFEIHG